MRRLVCFTWKPRSISQLDKLSLSPLDLAAGCSLCLVAEAKHFHSRIREQDGIPVRRLTEHAREYRRARRMGRKRLNQQQQQQVATLVALLRFASQTTPHLLSSPLPPPLLPAALWCCGTLPHPTLILRFSFPPPVDCTLSAPESGRGSHFKKMSTCAQRLVSVYHTHAIF